MTKIDKPGEKKWENGLQEVEREKVEKWFTESGGLHSLQNEVAAVTFCGYLIFESYVKIDIDEKL